MRSVLVKSAIAALVIYIGVNLIVTGPDSPATAQSAPIDPTSLTPTFDENFDKLDVSAWGPGTRWIAHTPWNGDYGDARFTDPGPDFPFPTRDGMLRIEARKGDDGKWRFDVVILDAPATGHGLDMLRVPKVIRDVVPVNLIDPLESLLPLARIVLLGSPMTWLPATRKLFSLVSRVGVSTPPSSFDSTSSSAINLLSARPVPARAPRPTA